ncbi:MAG: UDP-N-acetylmuramate dehydrogenase, partial [Synergistota bacterium]|nr:UDP-N-acetylmuramate dehydrogenase [Synergistota bacterium]
GNADALVFPGTPEEVAAIQDFAYQNALQCCILGGGTNVLVHDSGLRGIVIATDMLNRCEFKENLEAITVSAQAGVPLKNLLALSFRKGWTGLEPVAGIPGTVGGALLGNAGGRFGSMGDIVADVTVVGGKNATIVLKHSEAGFAYRKTLLARPGRVVTACTLSLARSLPERVAIGIRRSMSLRKGQPAGKVTAGCVFKNPASGAAGEMLDRAGCKDMALGGARVSASHANFIENAHGATSMDIFLLALECRKRVFELTGEHLEFEIQFLGEPWRSDEKAAV